MKRTELLCFQVLTWAGGASKCVTAWAAPKLTFLSSPAAPATTVTATTRIRVPVPTTSRLFATDGNEYEQDTNDITCTKDSLLSSSTLTLYVKAGPQGTDSSDCPFSHAIRMVLHELDVKYEMVPLTKDTKPDWLVEEHGGRLPALKHGDSVTTRFEDILKYILVSFDTERRLFPPNQDTIDAMDLDPKQAKALFPAISRYFKYSWFDKGNDYRREDVCRALASVEHYLSSQHQQHANEQQKTYWAGDQFTVLDCGLAPKLFHLKAGLEVFKDNEIDLAKEYPALAAYKQTLLERESFQQTCYKEAVVEWGWSKARQNLANFESSVPDMSGYFQAG